MSLLEKFIKGSIFITLILCTLGVGLCAVGTFFHACQLNRLSTFAGSLGLAWLTTCLGLATYTWLIEYCDW